MLCSALSERREAETSLCTATSESLVMLKECRNACALLDLALATICVVSGSLAVGADVPGTTSLVPSQWNLPADASSRSSVVDTAPNVRWLPGFRTWNYDFFGQHEDAGGRPLNSTDGPVNVVFVGATFAQITRALQPPFGCAASRCLHPQYMQFRHINTGTPCWVGNGGVRTDATFRCPFDGSAADYHIRLYRGPSSRRWGRTFVGTAHMDCETSHRFGWHEHAERFIAWILGRTFTVRASALHLSNAW